MAPNDTIDTARPRRLSSHERMEQAQTDRKSAENEIGDLEKALTQARERLLAAKRRYDQEELSHGQLERRRAIRSVQDAAKGFTKPLVSEDGHLTLTNRGAVWVAIGSGLVYYVLRLILRDQLGRYDWYKLLQKKSDRY